MANRAVHCARCHAVVWREAGHINRSRSIGAPIYCGRKCAGIARRKHKSRSQKKLEKKLYDAQYRKRNLSSIKAKKRAYFARTYDPVKAAVERKKTMARHVEYCRRPEYKKWKREYDARYRAQEYGPFAEAYGLSLLLNREIKSRMSNYEIRIQNQTGNKKQQRSRAAQEGQSRERNSRAQG